MYQGKKVLVAGGTGMIGSELVKALLEQGARVRIASLDDPSLAPPQTEFVRKDLTLLANCLDVCAGMDYVFNLTGVKGSPAVSTKKPASYLVPTLLMATSLMEAARRSGVERYLFTSSVGVYAPAEIFYEDDVWKTFPSPNDRFPGWAKRMGELLGEAYKIEYGWDKTVVVRPANVYGALDNFEGQNATVIPSLIRRAVNLKEDEPLVVWGDGSPLRDFIHARDVASGMMLALEKLPPTPINLGSGTGVTIRQLVETIAQTIGRDLKIVWDTSKPAGDRKRVMDISRARAIGFAPQVSLEQGLRETIAWYRAARDHMPKRYDVFNQPEPAAPK